MERYSIKEMSLLSGIKAHTIRIWEKRYKLFTPQRTDTNIRRYSDSDLKLLLNVSLLQSMGYKISKIAIMSDSEMNKVVTQGNKYTQPPPIPEVLFTSAMALDRETFSRKIDETIDSKGLEWTFENLIVPFQRRMGLLWQAGTITPAQEHFTTNIIREKLIGYSDAVPRASQGEKSILFFLPENEYHEISLLYFNYLARSKGFNTIYLGQSVPLLDVVSLGSNQTFDALFLSVTLSMPEVKFNEMLSIIAKAYPMSKKMVTGLQFEKNPNPPPNEFWVVKSAEQFKDLLKRI